jgi:hypothetical protein
MMPFRAVGALLLLAGASMTPAQSNLAPDADSSAVRAALDRFLSLNQARALAGDEAQGLLAGELDNVTQATFGALPPPDRIVMLADHRAVARLPAEGEARPDIYLYLGEHDGRWTIDALRTLALTGVIEEIRRRGREMTTRSPDIEAALRSAELTLSSDRQLAFWFNENRGALETLRTLAEAHRPVTGADDARIEAPETNAIVARLHLNIVSVSADGTVRVSIGGILDNEVGLLHVGSADLVPAIDPGSYIWIEPLGDGWYLFKTT